MAHAKKLPRVDEAPSQIICEPVFIADLKTKSAFDFDIYGIESRSTATNNIVNEFVLKRRALTENEWKMVLSNAPRKYEKEQIDAYETAITTDYENVMWKDPEHMDDLSKAVIVVDSFENWKDISEAILPLILRAYNGSLDGSLSEGDLLLDSSEEPMKIAMKMLSVNQPIADPVPPHAPLSMRPFSKRVQDEKEFTLYLTIPGRGAPAESAAVIAERWHGIQYLFKLANNSHRDVLWFDLIGEYTDSMHRKEQFRLKYQTETIRQFFKQRVHLNDISSIIRDCMYGGQVITSIQDSINEICKGSHKPIIIVTGWDPLRRSTPDSLKHFLDEIATNIFQSLPHKCEVIWFARPVPIAQNNIIYGIRCVAPFYQGKIWQNFVDTIVWNVVMPPNRTGARYPANDHERGVFIERPSKNLSMKVIDVEPLKGWGKDFHSDGRSQSEAFYKGSGQSLRTSTLESKQLSTCKSLIPHLLEKDQFSPRPRANYALEFYRTPSETYPTQHLQPLLSFKPTQIYALKNGQPYYEEGAPTIEVDGRIKVLLPMEKIDRAREYRPMELDTSFPQRSTRPPSEYYLEPAVVNEYAIAIEEIQSLHDSITFLKQERKNRLHPLLDQLSEITCEVNGQADSFMTSDLMTKLRLVLKILRTNILSNDVWDRLFRVRSMIPRNLTKAQKEHITSLQKRNPDILLLTGNHLFLLIVAALDHFDEVPYTTTLHELWEYLRPWHLRGLGFTLKYPENHNRGRSVLDRYRIYHRLKQRILEQQKVLDQQSSVTNIRFGQIIPLSNAASENSSYFWVLFQQKPGLFDMNAALLKSKWFDLRIDPIGTLREMVADRPFWSESDLVALSMYAQLDRKVQRIPMLIAEHRGQQVMWIGDDDSRSWIPIGQVTYSTQIYEEVTLVRTLTLTPNPHLTAFEYDEIREPIHQPSDMVEKTLLIIHAALGKCIPARCEVSLDPEEKMYKVTFWNQRQNTKLGVLLINRTHDLLEILRRPDSECEPVLVAGEKLVWNRFTDIAYDEDVAIVQSWVDRRDPFPGMALGLPPSARELLEAKKEFFITLELYHDPWTCPMRDLSIDKIKKSQEKAKKIGALYRQEYDRPWGEPDRIGDEPGIGHGSCWKVLVKTPQSFTPELLELQAVRFTDAQATALLRSQELAYQSQVTKEWITHTFQVEAKSDSIAEICESWRLRTMINDLTDRELNPSWYGVSLQTPDKWIPYFRLESEDVVIGLVERATGREVELELSEKHIDIRPTSEVREILETGMERLLETYGIVTDRRLNAAIQSEIDSTLELFEIEEQGAEITLSEVLTKLDKFGGEVIYVILTSKGRSLNLVVTEHLHNYRDWKVDEEEFICEVQAILDRYDLQEETRKEAIDKVLDIMREKELLREVL